MLKGKTAVVTGGSRGIGAAICKKFAENGADVALLFAGNTQKAEETKAALLAMGVKAEAYQCNVADAEQVAEVCKQILADFGSVDILVNNAGITKDKLVPMMKVPDFDSVVDTNLKGAFYMIKQFYPVFMKKRSGKIINISSVSGLMGNPGQTNYSASKAGLVGLTKSVAKELAARNVCCNAIAPGFVATDMTENLSEGNKLKDFIPMKRFGTPEDIAKLALFLASDQSDYITGEVIRIDGGLAM
ncbi:3-oxoacyl-[acyl-carrier-protein] reductase [Anaerotignum lactatifermentans]|uniref:3-oxoacyl-[acyl-carrier-protein] reductase n=1 Tax=Anaerotignum lactatifermentans TaxID=160404 RepID=A0ABS2G5R9_9FIRM|nr:3-oxoacyl-[acyl-carrier-protein] reductase [Anaerotignum lactatifermentans]MBM6828051.1 3-oxoacyl-[acyl-carrier-protein] reductase [Anaerotignum lactatifermentans]MBM6876786.1 3-oxoacyl-[acyl-carrier-protein] reductase [Anaerotignum lactatifermentans]MBM6949634.1 3-oxoacyl-[acyl-carrier-protein] reductase [Anaerotignum lactatifermentans]